MFQKIVLFFLFNMILAFKKIDSFLKLLCIFIFLLFLNDIKRFRRKILNSEFIDPGNLYKSNIRNSSNISRKNDNNKTINNKCFMSPNNSSLKIIHFIITRFLIEFYKAYGFPKKLYDEDYIPNGIRVMKKYLLNSLENQYCKNFFWILMIGNNSDITYIKSLLNFTNTFEKIVIFEKDIKTYIKNRTRGFDVLITTRIDYDDVIYYDAINDVRKQVNIEKPVLLYGYNKGWFYFESNGKYYDFNYKNNDGVWSIFISLITILNKVNETIIIYDLGDHSFIKKELLKSYKSFGIKSINYEPAIFDSGEPKFIYVRQKYSGSENVTRKVIEKQKEINISLNNFFVKYF